ncbi:hypothetical protein [Nonomuraea gerenzanensis]|uniref:Uncharacterized protein n=1 Tax=Nonomuraea gerenzanensis TaxID=93944 RepID=A0A1M4EBH7_9ACTN|nr:hypothetical protein [Nonomuraea gerenzanensis]UBU18325.1 hypothetical protein LCN96_25875 [Nonomuraea gerenzanensis]SBO96150.1 hypothetical protein BN4615_P5666 [Nonomuraea gerenzanensis]
MPDLRPETLAPHAEAVVRAALRDDADLGAFHVMLCTARPRPGSPPGPTRVLLTAVDSYALSGVVMALATRAAGAGSVPAGVHLAADGIAGFPARRGWH